MRGRNVDPLPEEPSPVELFRFAKLPKWTPDMPVPRLPGLGINAVEKIVFCTILLLLLGGMMTMVCHTDTHHTGREAVIVTPHHE